MSKLSEFFYGNKHKIMHKWDHYFDIYEKYLGPLREKKRIGLVEIGVFHGGSMQMWRDYFGDNALIFGVDINRECRKIKFDSYIDIVTANTGKEKDLTNLYKILSNAPGGIHVIIDDGSHRPRDQQKAFEALWPILIEGGIYIIEDIHTSYYYKGYGLGNIARWVTRKVIGDMHAKYKGKSHYYTMAKAVHYYPGMIVLEKDYPVELKDVISGTVDQDDPITNKLV